MPNIQKKNPQNHLEVCLDYNYLILDDIKGFINTQPLTMSSS